MAKGKFFDGKTAFAKEVGLTVARDILIIEYGGQVLGRWPLEHIFRDPNQISAVVIGCGTDDVRIELLDRDLYSTLKIGGTVWAKGHLSALKRPAAFWVAGILIFLAAFFGARRPVIRFVVDRISTQTEAAIGDKLVSRYGFKICELDSKQAAALNEMTKRLMPGTAKDVKVSIAQSSAANAFALPGAQIILLTGLLKAADSPTEIAGVLAHEITHVRKRHVLESLVESLFFVSLINLAAGDASGVMLLDPGTAARILSLKHNRQMEREADEGAVAILDAAHITTSGLIDFFKRDSRSAEAVQGALKNLAFLSTHPLNDERIEFLRQNETGPTDPELLTYDEWAALKSVSCP